MATVRISEIQHFSVGDGPGIRTTVFFKGCNLRCPWCHNPENLTAAPVTLTYAATGKTEVKGREAAPSELLPELLEDLDFYGKSGGGVTFSGGEVLLQPEGAAELAKLLAEKNVTVFFDTAGDVPFSAIETVDKFAAGYLFDYKCGSAEKLRVVTGGNLARITGNLEKLLAAGRNVRVRIPLIPGFNTGDASVGETVANLSSLGVREVDLLPFHRLASAKYEAMGLSYAYRAVPPLTKEEIAHIKALFEARFTVNLEK